MYGLVNKAISGLVQRDHGEATWQRILERSGVGHDSFVSMQAYDDQVTYDLVAAASEELGVPVPQLLEAFGEYWTLFTAEEGYGELLESFGSDLFGFLSNLDTMHTRIALNMPSLRPPSFRCEVIDTGVMLLEYRTEREGLEPMVLGLLRGLAQRFRTQVELSWTPPQAPHQATLFQVKICSVDAPEESS